VSSYPKDLRKYQDGPYTAGKLTEEPGRGRKFFSQILGCPLFFQQWKREREIVESRTVRWLGRLSVGKMREVDS